MFSVRKTLLRQETVICYGMEQRAAAEKTSFLCRITKKITIKRLVIRTESHVTRKSAYHVKAVWYDEKANEKKGKGGG